MVSELLERGEERRDGTEKDFLRLWRDGHEKKWWSPDCVPFSDVAGELRTILKKKRKGTIFQLRPPFGELRTADRHLNLQRELRPTRMSEPSTPIVA